MDMLEACGVGGGKSDAHFWGARLYILLERVVGRVVCLTVDIPGRPGPAPVLRSTPPSRRAADGTRGTSDETWPALQNTRTQHPCTHPSPWRFASALRLLLFAVAQCSRVDR